MAEEKKEEKKVIKREEIREESLIRILSTDIPGNKKVYPGLTRIKGISWAFSNAICLSLKIDKNRKMSSLSKEEISCVIKEMQ